MTQMIYSTVVSLDGYHTDSDGNFDRAEPDNEVPAFIKPDAGTGTNSETKRTKEHS